MMTKHEILIYIETLRAMPIEEYESAVDNFIDTLVKEGALADYVRELTALDESRDEGFKALYPVDFDELLNQV